MFLFYVKPLIITTLFSIGINNSAVNANDTFWQINYERALATANKEKKVLMLYFAGSDWCKPCIIWKEEVFDTESFQKFANNHLVPVKLDFPRLKKNRLPEEQIKQNEALAKTFNNEGVFPLIVFVDSSGTVLEKSTYRTGGPDEFIKYTETILAKHDQ